MAKKSTPDKASVTVTNEHRAIADLEPDRRNARRHPEKQIAQIVNSIERFGYAAPIIIRPSGRIIAGKWYVRGAAPAR